MRKSNELQTGKAGEYMVCADLILKGFVAFPSEQGLPYDVVLDTGGKLLRVQVKTTACPRVIPQRSGTESRAYIFSIKRAGKNNGKRLTEKDADIFALVCLDTRKVGYVPVRDMPSTINIRADHLQGTHKDERGIANFQKVKELSRIVSNQSEIARQTGIDVSIVNKMLKEGYKPYETGARYFSQFEREPEWFAGL